MPHASEMAGAQKGRREDMHADVDAGGFHDAEDVVDGPVSDLARHD